MFRICQIKYQKAIFHSQAVKTVAYLRVSTAQQAVRSQHLAILGVGVALAGLILTSVRGLRQDMQAQIGGLRGEIGEIRAEIGKLRERMAHLEGLLEGLREAITGRATAS